MLHEKNTGSELHCSGRRRRAGDRGVQRHARPADVVVRASGVVVGGDSSGATASAGGGGTDVSSLPGAENVGKVGGSGCGIPHGPWEEPAKKGGEVRVAWNDPPLSFNNNTTHSNAVAIREHPVLHEPAVLLLRPGPQLHQQRLSSAPARWISLDPLTVTYTVNEGVSWSDGTPVSAADLVLSWGAQSNVFNDEEAQLDEEGNLLPIGRRRVRQDRPVDLADQGIPDDQRRQPVRDLRLVRVLRRLPDRQPGDLRQPWVPWCRRTWSARTRLSLTDNTAGRAGRCRRLQEQRQGRSSSRSPTSGTRASTPISCRRTRTCTCPPARTRSPPTPSARA